MANKKQRKAQKAQLKERLAKKRGRRDIRQGKRPDASVGATLRQVQRLARQKPRAWPGEAESDVAVFDPQVRESLPAEAAEQASAVAEAIGLICDALYPDAVARVSHIPRSSPWSEWRLFVRGLAVWAEANDPAAAREFWDRLDGQRRPGRMAMALLAAHRTDLESLHGGEETHEAHRVGDSPALDNTLLYGAKLIRRSRLDRKAIAQARQITSAPDEDSTLLLGPKKLSALRLFSAEYKELEPSLVRALQQAALHRAYVQNYVDLYKEASQAFPGPPHDPKNSLLSFFFWDDEKGGARSDRCIETYLTRDLPANKLISDRLRMALASQIHLQDANLKVRSQESNPFSFFGPRIDPREVEDDFQKSIKAYPTNLAAHKAHVAFLRGLLEDQRASKAEQAKREARLVKAMVAWSKALPDQIEPRLWLVDHFLEEENLDEAKPHVDWLSTSRHDDPRVRATPWKWRLLEASRMCRRKTWLSEAQERLAEAEASWPAWLSRDWLAYLKAALTLRRGETEAFDAQRAAIGQGSGVAPDSLPAACMMLAAAQHMRVPAPLLKPLREPIDNALKRLNQLPLDELIAAGNFFWDLQRTSLIYPAYRMHGTKFAGELLNRLKQDPETFKKLIRDDKFQNAVLWLSKHRFMATNYDVQIPPVLRQAAHEIPKYAAAANQAVLSQSSPWRIRDLAAERKVLKEAAPTQSDPYYRYWFAALAEEAEQELAKSNSKRGGLGPFGRFASFFGSDDLDDDEDSSGATPGCDCPRCTAARKAAAAR